MEEEKYCYGCGIKYKGNQCPKCADTIYTEKPNSQTRKSNYLGTTNCIRCYDKVATFHCGHVIGKDIGALGIPFDVKILAGFCSEECHNSLKSDRNGCFGEFNFHKHGEVKDCYEEMFRKK